MSREEYLQLTDLFSQLLEVPPSERIAALESACTDVPQFRQPLEAMLRQDELLGTAADRDVFAGVVADLQTSESLTEDETLPERISSRIFRRPSR